VSALGACALYRFWGGGQLLYVGISVRPGHRFGAHARKDWWREVETITMDWFPSSAEALRAEGLAIRFEGPVYNILGNGPRKPRAKRRPREAPEFYDVEPVTDEDALQAADELGIVLPGLAERVERRRAAS